MWVFDIYFEEADGDEEMTYLFPVIADCGSDALAIAARYTGQKEYDLIYLNQRPARASDLRIAIDKNFRFKRGEETMSNYHSSSGFLNCVLGDPDTWRPMGIKIVWVPEFRDPISTVPAHFSMRLYTHDGETAALVLTVSMGPEQFDDFCSAFSLAIRQADDDRVAAETKEHTEQ